MMVQDEQENAQQEEFCRAIIDGDAQQEAEPGAPPRDCEAGSTGEVGSGSGWVYFIRSPDGTFMKIGFTRLAVLVRFAQIGNGLPGLQLVGYLPGSRDTEFWIHAKFRELQANGEWFRCETSLLAFMDAIGLIVPTVQAKRRPVMRKKVKPVTIKQIVDDDEADYQHSMAAIREGGKDISLAALKRRYGYVKRLVAERTKVTEDRTSAPATDGINRTAREYFRKQGARGGKIGAKARMEKLTPEQRSDIARNAVAARERKRAQNGTFRRPESSARTSDQNPHPASIQPQEK
jgi:hypothetical protein